MFSRFATTVLPLAALAAVATAAPNALEARASSQCNTGDNYCCDTSQTLPTNQISYFTGLLGGPLVGVGAIAGLTCSPVTVVGGGTGGSCTQQPVCCSNNDYNGVVVVGCTPISIVV